MPPIKELARPGMRVTIAFDDPTVPQIESQVWKQAIGLSLQELYAAGVKKKDIWAGSIPATRKAALAEMRKRFTRRRDMVTETADIVLYGVPEGSPNAAFSYTSILWSILLGYFLFGDLPDELTMAGVVIIISSGLYIMQRERRLKDQLNIKREKNGC